MTNKHFKRSALQTSFADPGEVIDIDDASNVYGDHIEWPDVQEPCPKSPVGQCEYGDCDPERCKHCGRVT